MDKYTEDNTKKIIEQINTLLKPLAKEYGLKVNVVEPKFSDIYLEATLSLELLGKEQAEEEERRKYFEEHCEELYLSPQHFGMEFTYYPHNRRCQVYGLDFHNPEYPIILKDLDTLELIRTSPMFFLNSI